MDLFRDCLDKRIEDRSGRPMGRADGIIIEIEDGRQPQIAAVEVGILTRADRISRRVGRFIQRFFPNPSRTAKQGEPNQGRYRLPWSKIVAGGNVLIADFEAEDTPALALELWLRKKVIGRIPGA